MIGIRSEEHTSELQSHLNLVCRLLLEKKKNIKNQVKLYSRLLYITYKRVKHAHIGDHTETSIFFCDNHMSACVCYSIRHYCMCTIHLHEYSHECIVYTLISTIYYLTLYSIVYGVVISSMYRIYLIFTNDNNYSSTIYYYPTHPYFFFF